MVEVRFIHTLANKVEFVLVQQQLLIAGVMGVHFPSGVRFDCHLFFASSYYFCFLFGRSWAKIWDWRPIIMTEVFRGFLFPPGKCRNTLY
jgi:hypothetical protein